MNDLNMQPPTKESLPLNEVSLSKDNAVIKDEFYLYTSEDRRNLITHYVQATNITRNIAFNIEYTLQHDITSSNPFTGITSSNIYFYSIPDSLLKDDTYIYEYYSKDSTTKYFYKIKTEKFIIHGKQYNICVDDRGNPLYNAFAVTKSTGYSSGVGGRDNVIMRVSGAGFDSVFNGNGNLGSILINETPRHPFGAGVTTSKPSGLNSSTPWSSSDQASLLSARLLGIIYKEGIKSKLDTNQLTNIINDINSNVNDRVTELSSKIDTISNQLNNLNIETVDMIYNLNQSEPIPFSGTLIKSNYGGDNTLSLYKTSENKLFLVKRYTAPTTVGDLIIK